MCETEQIMETPYENPRWSWRRTLRPSSINNLPLLLHANPNSQDKSLLCCCGPLYWHCICQQSVFFPHCRLILARRLMKTQVQVLLRNDTHRRSTYFLHFVTSLFCQQKGSAKIVRKITNIELLGGYTICVHFVMA